jgi:hypothetical protein
MLMKKSLGFSDFSGLHFDRFDNCLLQMPPCANKVRSWIRKRLSTSPLHPDKSGTRDLVFDRDNLKRQHKRSSPVTHYGQWSTNDPDLSDNTWAQPGSLVGTYLSPAKLDTRIHEKWLPTGALLWETISRMQMMGAKVLVSSVAEQK